MSLVVLLLKGSQALRHLSEAQTYPPERLDCREITALVQVPAEQIQHQSTNNLKFRKRKDEFRFDPLGSPILHYEVPVVPGEDDNVVGLFF